MRIQLGALALLLSSAANLSFGQVAATQPFADGDVTIRPPYVEAPEITPAAGVPRGVVHRFSMKSQDSAFYPGIDKTRPGEVVPYTRSVAVYVPVQYQAGTAAPFIVVQDGTSATNLRTLPPVLDSLIAQKKLPVMVAVMVNNGGGDSLGSERGLEYDTVSDKYTMFVEKEVLPRAASECHVTFTSDPEGRATMGGSSGAAAAFTMAWFHPELYHRVISYSGTFVNQESPVDPQYPRGAWEYHATLVPGADAKPIRVWMEAGQNDNGSARDEASLHNWVLANQRMAAALKAKGYHYRYVFAEGAGHTDRRVIAQTLPEALLYAWAGYQTK